MPQSPLRTPWVSVLTLALSLGITGCQSDSGSSDSIDAAPAETTEVAATQPAEPSREQKVVEGRLGMLMEEIELCEQLGLDPVEIAALNKRPLYTFNETEVHRYLQFLHATQPDLRTRVKTLARKNLGQPYEIYLLGEAPFETYDPQPLYCLDRSDCVVYVEHMLAMGLGSDWPKFFGLLQRIRYNSGQIGLATRNHYSEADWAPNNSWLVTDISEQVAGDGVATYPMKVDRARMLKRVGGLEVAIPVESRVESYVPFEETVRALPELQTGDLAFIVRGTGPESLWVGHMTMVIRTENDAIHLIHSTPPVVKEEPITEYIRRSVAQIPDREAAGKSRFYGFKFMRLNEDALDRLVELDGPDAPVLSLPSGARLQMSPQAKIAR
ncbi:N-acetylmuramoyl-L-alanine amidase-like domain-containing protein [Mucisphaera calidilacus]|uniref:DUF1460 domain-containing protein n=1 Tax=Mucisphaera calidilacus TaxID=2527982 RepID=A0A518BTG4_9BACT|nr:N-acetylmuramoyl-L-alanine amidase-like domain-containing protein [Mucisphaera calidilacus]QDU70263.1 hypothetical protein Pan265_00860 [Mucisphaera calidilacus]